MRRSLLILTAVGILTAVVSLAPTPSISRVFVTNWPAVQPVNGSVNVAGTVNVENFPATQAVTGTVAVSNLPPVTVAVKSNQAMILHSTSLTYTGNLGGRTGATEKCLAEFPNSHFPSTDEILQAFGTRGIVWLNDETSWAWVDILQISPCSLNGADWSVGDNTGNGSVMKGSPSWSTTNCDLSHPLICAE